MQPIIAINNNNPANKKGIKKLEYNELAYCVDHSIIGLNKIIWVNNKEFCIIKNKDLNFINYIEI